MGKFSDKYDLNKAKLLKQLIEKSYKKGNFTLSSGKKSIHYLNCKPVSLNSEGLNLISDLFLELKDSRSKAVAGLTLGADPLVSGLIVKAVLHGLDLDGLIIRKEIKKYGTKSGIEGPTLQEGKLHFIFREKK